MVMQWHPNDLEGRHSRITISSWTLANRYAHTTTLISPPGTRVYESTRTSIFYSSIVCISILETCRPIYLLSFRDTVIADRLWLHVWRWGENLYDGTDHHIFNLQCPYNAKSAHSRRIGPFSEYTTDAWVEFLQGRNRIGPNSYGLKLIDLSFQFGSVFLQGHYEIHSMFFRWSGGSSPDMTHYDSHGRERSRGRGSSWLTKWRFYV